MTVQVRKMLRDGLCERVPDSVDRRVRRITITTRGRELLTRLRAAPAGSTDEALTDAVRDAGANRIYAAATHGVFSGNAWENLAAAGFEQISIEFTHEVEDGMHAAIVKAVKAEGAGRIAKPLLLSGGQSRGKCCG